MSPRVGENTISNPAPNPGSRAKPPTNPTSTRSMHMHTLGPLGRHSFRIVRAEVGPRSREEHIPAIEGSRQMGPMAPKPRKPFAHHLHEPATHPQLLGFFSTAPGALAVAALHVFAFVGDPSWAPVAAGGIGPLAPSRGRRILVAKPMPHCARISLMETEIGAEETDEVGARAVDGVPLEPQVAPLRERHVEGGHQHEVL